MIFILVIDEREIVPLPVVVGSRAVQRKNERDLLARLPITREIEEKLASGLRLGGVAWIENDLASARRVGTMQRRRILASNTKNLRRVFLGVSNHREKRYRDKQQERAGKKFHVGSSYTARALAASIECCGETVEYRKTTMHDDCEAC